MQMVNLWLVTARRIFKAAATVSLISTVMWPLLVSIQRYRNTHGMIWRRLTLTPSSGNDKVRRHQGTERCDLTDSVPVSKFASVQDRLREWDPAVRTKIEHLNCLQITVLDIDGFRMDKGLQITADAEGEWAYHIRQCAAAVGKRNFFIPGEVVGGNPLSAVYIVGNTLLLISLLSLIVI